MECRRTKNTASYFAIPMIDASAPQSYKDGETVTDTAYYKDGAGAWTSLAITDTFTEIAATGLYECDLTAAEMNHDQIIIKLTATNSQDQGLVVSCVPVEEDIIDNGITSGKYDESTAFPIGSADTGSTEIARTGADGDTLETLSDQVDLLETGVNVDEWGGQSTTGNTIDMTLHTLHIDNASDAVLSGRALVVETSGTSTASAGYFNSIAAHGLQLSATSGNGDGLVCFSTAGAGMRIESFNSNALEIRASLDEASTPQHAVYILSQDQTATYHGINIDAATGKGINVDSDLQALHLNSASDDGIQIDAGEMGIDINSNTVGIAIDTTNGTGISIAAAGGGSQGINIDSASNHGIIVSGASSGLTLSGSTSNGLRITSNSESGLYVEGGSAGHGMEIINNSHAAADGINVTGARNGMQLNKGTGVDLDADGLAYLVGNAIGTAPVDSSILANMASKSGTPSWASFVNTTDSLEAIRDNQSGSTPATIADAVWDELLSGHVGAGSYGKAVADIETDATAILVDTGEIGTAGAGLTDLGGMSTGMKAEVEAEATDALNAYDGPTHAEMTAEHGTINTNIDANETKIDSIQTDTTNIETDTQDIQSKIGTPVALDGGAATVGSMLTKMSDDNGGADFDATTDSLEKIADAIGGTPLTAQQTRDAMRLTSAATINDGSIDEALIVNTWSISYDFTTYSKAIIIFQDADRPLSALGSGDYWRYVYTEAGGKPSNTSEIAQTDTLVAYDTAAPS